MNVPFASSVGLIKTNEDINVLVGGDLVKLHNELTGLSVKKFADKKSGLKRTYVAFAVWQQQQTEKPDKVAGVDAKTYRKGSRRGEIIQMAAKSGGTTIGAISQELKMEVGMVRQTLGRIKEYNGLTVTLTGEADDNQVVVVSGQLRTRKPFVFEPKKVIKEHKPNTKRAKVIELCSAPGGATFEQIMAATEWDERTAYEGIRLLNGWVGYGLRESGDGRITIYK